MLCVLQRNPIHGQEAYRSSSSSCIVIWCCSFLGVIYCSLPSLRVMDSSIEVLEWHVGVLTCNLAMLQTLPQVRFTLVNRRLSSTETLLSSTTQQSQLEVRTLTGVGSQQVLYDVSMTETRNNVNQ